MLGSDAGLPSAKRARTAPPTFSHDPGTATRISRQPMLADPFESLRVEARASRLPNAGEGLFARRALAEGEVAAFYAGVRLSHAVVDGRGWEENDNTLSIVSRTIIAGIWVAFFSRCQRRRCGQGVGGARPRPEPAARRPQQRDRGHHERGGAGAGRGRGADGERRLQVGGGRRLRLRLRLWLKALSRRGL